MRLVGLGCVLVLLVMLPATAVAKVMYSKQGALKLAFPGADEVKQRHYFLTDDQLQRVQQIAGQKVESKLVTVYEGHNSGRVVGYALIDTHIVRTLPATFMTVLNPSGEILAVHILAFHEPLEYLPPPRWLAQFRKRRLAGKLQVERGIAGIAGSTLSAHAVTKGTRMVLALYQVLLKPQNETHVSTRRTGPKGRM